MTWLGLAFINVGFTVSACDASNALTVVTVDPVDTCTIVLTWD